ncbi:UbiA family prenyltransferase [Aquihabitans sp. G128]|uniref:UbiA family prenyltransferase n=1 Tax=Aquihabitans sp. G128 TaxID=2849779 RepID=UPI001C21B6D2|nr:UbiA family prenyltransferase [Aquihabitans sp. G128]QXC60289.1 UbiA family prenyltransferase [Aquihabitans sp. G128]
MQTRRVVRSEQWWDHKVPVLVAAGALAIGSRPGAASLGDLGQLVLLVVSVVGVAAFGHLVNDWCDLEADARAGKGNRLVALSGARRTTLVAAALVVGLAPWLLLERRPAALLALALELALLLAYSVPPLRLKGRGALGAAADAGYAYAVPLVLVVLAVGPRGHPHAGPLLAVLALWGFVQGLRGILWHQIEDLDADQAAGTSTWALALGRPRAERLVGTALLPVELVLLAALVVLVGRWWIAGLLVGFALWRTFQLLFLWTEPLDPSSLRQLRHRVQVVGFEYVNDLLERWLPLAAVVWVAWSSPWWWLGVAAVLLGFRNAVRTFVAWDVWVLPDGIERLAYARRASRDIQEVARRRRARVAAGPGALADPAARRWVFVVCGPAMHVETLATALGHLRPLTAAEIWVVTDVRRNAIPIDHPGIDHVVDVATPGELDDHQASIWLKTSVHRHLPQGEWCYLDSDIIAVAPGVEVVFDHRDGPVAFASDLTIRENSVDRFSPWAMTCSCLGYDDEHSCGHLREQLAARFDVEVPGDWLHWNGGVFVFGPEAAPVLDLWHERAVASFAWPEWRTRDQGALIATVWSLGLQDLPRLPPTCNFIADLGNFDLCLDVERGWAHHPSGPWYDARLLHCYTSALEDPEWDLGRDVEAVVLRRSRVRIYRYRRAEAQSKVAMAANDVRWSVQERLELTALRVRRFPRRLAPGRLWRAVLARLGRSVGEPPPPGPQRADGPA